MLEPFILRALLAGIGVAIVAGAIGCFVVWKRMAYFGDSLAHSALLGIALGLAVGLDMNLGVILVCSGFAVLLLWLQRKNILTTDTLLGILAHSALSVGLITFSMLEESIDIHVYLFGDILTVTYNELYWIYAGGVLVAALLIARWSSLILTTINEDLAMAEGINPFWNQLLFMFLMTVTVAVCIRIVGILLIASLLIIPAATARQFARTPEMMAAVAIVLGMVAVCGGILGSMRFDTPSGPSIVAVAAALFLLLSPLSHWFAKRIQ